MPRVGRGKKDYNMAMDPALLNAGKIVAAAEDRNLATLLRSLLREHIEKASPEQAKHIYETAAEVPHGTQIDRFGPTRTAIRTLMSGPMSPSNSLSPCLMQLNLRQLQRTDR